MSKETNSTFIISSGKSDTSLDLEQLRGCVRRLKNVHHVFTNKANKVQRKDHQFFIECVKNVNDNVTKTYITNIVKEEFKDVKDCEPGTFGSYFKGCFMSSNFENNACTPTCVASFSPNSIPGCIDCDTLCIIMEKDGSYNVLNENIENPKKCYVFIKKEHNIKRLNKKIIYYLKNKNVKEYNIVLFEGETYENLYFTFISVDAELDDSSSITNKSKKCSNKGYWIALIIIVILILLLVLAGVGALIFYRKE